MKAAEQLYRIPDGGAVDHDRGRCGGVPDERVQSHRRRQRDRLTDRLLALVAGEAGEGGNVQRDSGPESDGAIQSRSQEFQEVWKVRKLRRHREHRAESAGGVVGPAEKKQADAKKNRRADALQHANVFNALEHDGEIDQPENEEAYGGAVGKNVPTRDQYSQQRADGFAADPG